MSVNTVRICQKHTSYVKKYLIVMTLGFTFSPLAIAIDQVHTDHHDVQDSQSSVDRAIEAAVSQQSQYHNPDVITAPLANMTDISTHKKSHSIDRFYKHNNIKTKKRNYSDSNIHCEGAWTLPNQLQKQADYKLSENTHDNSQDIQVNQGIYAEADALYYSPNKKGELVGNVHIKNDTTNVLADTVTLDLKNDVAKANGSVITESSGFISQAELITFDLNSKKSTVESSAFFSTKSQANGNARSISTPREGVVTFKDVNYSTCPPSVPNKKSNTHSTKKSPKPWEVSAQTLTVDNNTGRAKAYGAVLKVADYPIAYLPYLNFPVDDRRMSGFLTPKIGLSNIGGIDISTPYYLNLASNYDVTLTPRLLSKRGGMITGELRYLSDYGKTLLDFGYLPHDSKYNNLSRTKYSAQHMWQISPTLSLHGFYHHVSDKDYLSDLYSESSISDKLNIPRGVTLSFDNGANLTSQLKIETFQTVNNNVRDKNKPYSRLPQITSKYNVGNPLGLHSDVNIDMGYFIKSINDKSTNQDSGFRSFEQVNLGYNYAKPWGFIEPKASLKHISTRFDNESSVKQGQRSVSVTQPEISVTGELVFEKETHFSSKKYKQTIRPQLFYVNAPFRNQSKLPNYNTVVASLNYDQLFINERFIGNDRLADAHALSLGMMYQIHDETGLERLNIGLANQVNFTDYQTTLKGDKETIPRTSGTIMRVQSYVTPKVKFMSDFALTNNGDNNFHISTLSWRPHAHTLVNVGLFQRNQLEKTQEPLKQQTFSFMVPFLDRWQVFGHSQYDLKQNKVRELLIGANYESCCYRFAVYGRNYYNSLDTLGIDKPNKMVMAEITLKGLAGFSGKLDNLLEKKIFGINDVLTPWLNQ